MDRFPQRTTIGVAPLEISNISSKSSDVNTVPECHHSNATTSVQEDFEAKGIGQD